MCNFVDNTIECGFRGNGQGRERARQRAGGIANRQADSPFADTLPREVTRDAHWIEPDLVGEVAYAVWTSDNRLRHPVWRGVRDDLEPDDVVVEP